MNKSILYIGSGIYDKPLLVTFPRSGTNWIRYNIEFFSDKPTPGQKRLVSGSDFIIDRAHFGWYSMEKYKSVILCLRNYKENLIGDSLKNTKDIENYLEVLSDDFEHYIKNIEAFDKFKGEKLLLYYSDIIKDPLEIKKILDFCKINYKKEKFISYQKEFENHKNKSFSMRKGKSEPSNIKYWSDLTSKKILYDLDNYIENKWPVIFEKYLKEFKDD